MPKVVRDLNRREVEKIISKYFEKNTEQLDLLLTSTTLPSIELMIIKIITESIKKGDQFRFSFLLDRTIGKVKETIEMNNPDGNLGNTVIVTLPSNGREKKID